MIKNKNNKTISGIIPKKQLKTVRKSVEAIMILDH